MYLFARNSLIVNVSQSVQIPLDRSLRQYTLKHSQDTLFPSQNHRTHQHSYNQELSLIAHLHFLFPQEIYNPRQQRSAETD